MGMRAMPRYVMVYDTFFTYWHFGDGTVWYTVCVSGICLFECFESIKKVHN